MGRAISLLTCLILMGAVPGPAVAADFERELERAEAMLLDVGVRSDVRGLELARQRLAELLDDSVALDSKMRARILRDMALVEFNLVMALAGGVERAAEAAVRMLDTTREALEIRPRDPELQALLNRAHYMMFISGAADAESLQPELRESAARARELDPQHPLVRFIRSLELVYGRDRTAADEGLEMMRGAIEDLAGDRSPVGRLWYLLTRNIEVQTLLGRGGVAEARRRIDDLLEDRPDYWIVRETLLPMTEPAEPVEPPALTSDAWIELARDPEGDTPAPGLPDARSLAYHHDRDTDRLWFRIALHDGVDPASIGINLPVDVDRDPGTGSPWWGGNTAFRWDRLVTVWVARMEDGSYRGAVGMGDTLGAADGRYVNLAQGNVDFAFDEDALYVSFPRTDLTSEDRFDLIGVVGTNTRWSDPVPDEGHVSVDLTAH